MPFRAEEFVLLGGQSHQETTNFPRRTELVRYLTQIYTCPVPRDASLSINVLETNL